jgi:lipopolysaccharide export system permease protein
MRTLSRYVLREFLVPLTYCIVGFLGIYVVFELFDSIGRIMDSKPPVMNVFGFFAGYISPYLQYLIPAALLLGTLYTMWNFCRHSEITAMRASGIGFLVIVRPLLLVAAVLAVAVAAVNEFYAPWASEKARDYREGRFKELNAKTFENVVFYNMTARRIWRVDRIDAAKANVLKGVHISFDRPDGSREMDVGCDRAEYLDGQWWLVHPVYHYFDPLNNAVPSPKPQLAELTLRPFPEFNETPRDFLLMSKAWEYYTVRDMLHFLRYHPNLTKEVRKEKWYDIHARLAAPFSCLIITLFAIPAGVATGRQSVFKGVMCALGMFFAFYALQIGCMVLAKNGPMPAIPAAWCANIVFLAIGLILFWRQR